MKLQNNFKSKKLHTLTLYQTLLKQLQYKTHEFSQETTDDPQSITITDDSNILQIPVHNITQTHINDHISNDTTHYPNQDNTSTLSTSNTLTTQELQPQQTMQPNYDPPPLPSQYSPPTAPHNSPQQGYSNTQVINTVQYQTPKTQPEVPTLAYTPAQTTQTQICNLH